MYGSHWIQRNEEPISSGKQCFSDHFTTGYYFQKRVCGSGCVDLRVWVAAWPLVCITRAWVTPLIVSLTSEIEETDYKPLNRIWPMESKILAATDEKGGKSRLRCWLNLTVSNCLLSQGFSASPVLWASLPGLGSALGCTRGDPTKLCCCLSTCTGGLGLQPSKVKQEVARLSCSRAAHLWVWHLQWEMLRERPWGWASGLSLRPPCHSLPVPLTCDGHSHNITGQVHNLHCWRL